MSQMKVDLRLSDEPRHIECFDNSNIQGTHPVAACVVFKNGKPSKKDYRHFNIKTVDGPDDYASMEEVVFRRYKRLLEETDVQLLELAITEIRQRFHSTSKEIYVPFKIELGNDLKITVPKLGDKKHILDLSIRNAKYYRMDRFKQIKITDPDRHANRIMSQMKVDLRLSDEPRHIECFDNSNIQGTHPVAACVVFKNGKPSKKNS